MNLFGFLKHSLQEMRSYPDTFWVHVLDQWGVKIHRAGITDGLCVDMFVGFMADAIYTYDNGVTYRWVSVLISMEREETVWVDGMECDEDIDEDMDKDPLHHIGRNLYVPCSDYNHHFELCKPLRGKGRVTKCDLNDVHSQSSALLRQMPTSFQLGVDADTELGFCYSTESTSIHSQWSVVSDNDDRRVFRIDTFSLTDATGTNTPVIAHIKTHISIDKKFEDNV
ncbi:MAG: hypothetical protein ACYC1M_16630 [Armatimonadota bacterium]